MNYKHLVTCVLALGVTGAANAAQAPARDTPDFVFTVPMELKNIPGEVHTVVVWCEALNAVYNSVGGDQRDPRASQDPKNLQFRNGPQIIASTGAVAIRVKGHLGAKGQAGPNEKPFPAWSVDQIEAQSRMGPKGLVPRVGGKLDDVELAQLPSTTYMIVPKGGGLAPSPNVAVALYANTTGATDPALGTAFACHMGFKASAMVDGKPTEFDVFAGQGSYEGMPDEVSKDPKADAKGLEGRGGAGFNPAKVLTVYGNFLTKDGKPAGK